MDFSEVNLTLFVIAAVIGAITLFLHVLSCVLDGRGAELVSYVNIGLHVPLIALAALSGAPIIVGVALVLASLCVYMASQYFCYRRQQRAAVGEGEEDRT